jgi:uncharacterized cupredoxin-like copper-binding protein
LCVAAVAVAVAAEAQARVAAPAVRVSVTATEFRFALSRRTVPRGPVVFALSNAGDISHDFRILGRRSPVLTPGRRKASLRVTFARAGRYTFICTLPSHREAGMQGVITVR